jgi:hypothetical protein
MTVPTNQFPRETSGLPAAAATTVVELSDGDRFPLRIAPVSKRIGDANVRMLAYNGSIPGPTLRVPEGVGALLRGRRRRHRPAAARRLGPLAITEVKLSQPAEMTASNVATFLFADIAGFTALTEAHGDDKPPSSSPTSARRSTRSFQRSAGRT